MRRTRLTLLAAALTSLLAALAAPASASAGVVSDLPVNVGSAHVLWQKAHSHSDAQTNPNQLLYHGGAVETKPAVYLVFWGPAWQSGFTASHGGFTYTQASAMTYLQDFFGSVGGSPWNGV